MVYERESDEQQRQLNLTVISGNPEFPLGNAEIERYLTMFGVKCRVCIDVLSGHMIYCSQCAAIYHKGCLVPWAAQESLFPCPNCRASDWVFRGVATEREIY